MLQNVSAVFFGYFCGSIPFGLILTRVAGTADLRAIGSKNIGATNVLRTGRKDLAALTLFLDLLKGTAAVLIAAHFAPGKPMFVAALGAFLGHLFPVWLRFRGGKGVATFLGCLLATAWQVAIAFGVTWLAVGIFHPILLGRSSYCERTDTRCPSRNRGKQRGAHFWSHGDSLWERHRVNIGRLAAGTESRIGSS